MKKTYLPAVTDALDCAMGADPDVVIIGEDVGVYGGGMGATRGLLEKYTSSRVIETPISETAFTGAAVGCALLGMRPVVEIIFSDFTSLAVDPIVNHAAKFRFMSAGTMRVPMVVRTPLGAGTGAAAQHSQSVENMFLNVPGLTVLAPSDAYDAKGLLISAIELDDPVVFFEHKKCYPMEGEVPEGSYRVPIGKADIKKLGRDISIISYSRMSCTALEAAYLLEKDGISAEVVDLRSLRPLDVQTIAESVMKTKRALIVTEAPVFGGFSGELESVVYETAGSGLMCPVRRLGGEEMPVAYSESIESQQIPDAEKIIKTVKEMLS